SVWRTSRASSSVAGFGSGAFFLSTPLSSAASWGAAQDASRQQRRNTGTRRRDMTHPRRIGSERGDAKGDATAPCGETQSPKRGERKRQARPQLLAEDPQGFVDGRGCLAHGVSPHQGRGGC